MTILMFNSLRQLPTIIHRTEPSWISPAMYKGSNFSTSCQHLFQFILTSWWYAIVQWHFTVVLVCIPLRTMSIFSCVCWPFVYLFWRNVYSTVLSGTYIFLRCLPFLKAISNVQMLRIPDVRKSKEQIRKRCQWLLIIFVICTRISKHWG